MTPLSDDALIALLDAVESDRVERKRAWAGDAPEKVRQAVCAFANDLPGHALPGVVFIGAADDGSPHAIAVDDQLLKTLADIKTDGKTIPLPSLIVESRLLKGVAMAVVTVWPADAPPVRYEGRIWIRIGPRRGLASAQDERILNERRQHQDRAFDASPVRGSTVADLDRSFFEYEFLPHAVAADVLAANERSMAQRMAALGLVTSDANPVPTVAGVLVAGKSPRTWLPSAYIQFLRVRGTEFSGPVVDAEEIDGSMTYMLRRLDDKLRGVLTTAVDFTSATHEIKTTAYPLSALQQLIRNAVIHRTYEGTNAPVRVYWFDDRIEIYSPGGPYGVVNASNFGEPGAGDYRNLLLAGMLKILGFVQRFGFGIDDARRALAANGNPPPEFNVQPTMVLVTVRATPV